jgi:hypothetical protein
LAINWLQTGRSFADGQAAYDELKRARKAIRGSRLDSRAIYYAKEAARGVVRQSAWDATWITAEHVASALLDWPAECANDRDEFHWWFTGSKAKHRDLNLAALLRHILGNPFRIHLRPAHLAPVVMQLAESLYNGADCCFALHDALLEAGHPDLAEHFMQATSHPKGCWVVDLLRGEQ